MIDSPLVFPETELVIICLTAGDRGLSFFVRNYFGHFEEVFENGRTQGSLCYVAICPTHTFELPKESLPGSLSQLPTLNNKDTYTTMVLYGRLGKVKKLSLHGHPEPFISELCHLSASDSITYRRNNSLTLEEYKQVCVPIISDIDQLIGREQIEIIKECLRRVKGMFQEDLDEYIAEADCVGEENREIG
ncbi:hypothetical protein COEREDRAFT_88606 [Coemansia reversa NRRL 1564]|uniref:Uncharacterized protein n=1 Tax=Coemansia reversa (strain ATCC 12441 / NRRL 1564) TaxID=763665 RepID=A0A2G5B6J7_COERN|nr:hypothetical protein COEREDRAFT_88606 [Coemansia reversa NRRL 1564]|eukprot:PIA14635.1 hypothetical protein COEREDRAFT_88606 [Coemansia reversa NRRL 1564]